MSHQMVATAIIRVDDDPPLRQSDNVGHVDGNQTPRAGFRIDVEELRPGGCGLSFSFLRERLGDRSIRPNDDEATRQVADRLRRSCMPK